MISSYRAKHWQVNAISFSSGLGPTAYCRGFFKDGSSNVEKIGPHKVFSRVFMMLGIKLISCNVAYSKGH